MSGTSALVVVQTGEKEYKCSFVGYDGYPSGTGKMLVSYYNSLVRANSLVSGGHMVAVKPTNDVYDETRPYGEDGTEYYVRDCGAHEHACGVKVAQTIRDVIKATGIDYVYYVYLWKDDRWYFSSYDLDFLANLAESLANAETL